MINSRDMDEVFKLGKAEIVCFIQNQIKKVYIIIKLFDRPQCIFKYVRLWRPKSGQRAGRFFCFE